MPQKKLKKPSSYFLLVIFIFISSCKKDENNDPPINLPSPPHIVFNYSAGYTSNSVTIGAGQSIICGIIASSPSKLVKFKWEVIADNSPVEIKIDSTINSSNFNFVFNGLVSNHFLETWIFSVTDDAGQTQSIQFTLTIEHLIKTVSATIQNQYATFNECFFSTLTELSYTAANSPAYSSQIDFGFYNNASGSVLASPTSTNLPTVYPVVNNWPTTNNTLFAVTSLSVSDFGAITDGSQIATYAASANQTEIANIVTGIIIAFKTATGKMGLAKVANVYGTPVNNGQIDLLIKIEQ